MSTKQPAPDRVQSIHQNVMDAMDRYHMITAGHRVLVALSGGPDSSVLAHVLGRLTDRYRLQLAAAHCHHGLRDDADADEAAARALAARLGIPFFRTSLDVRAHSLAHRMSLEVAGRHLRYRYFHQLAAIHGFQRLALGHHRDDTAEQVMMNLIRGCGSTGLSGIQPVRDQWIIRPMIGIRKQAILEYARSVGVPFATDASNRDRRFTRNRVRLDLLPALARGYNPRITDTLARLAVVSADEDQWMNQMAADLLTSIIRDQSDTHITIEAASLAAMPTAAGRRVLRQCVHRLLGHTDRVTLKHMDNALALAESANGAGRIDLPWRLRFSRRGPHLRIDRRTLPHRVPQAPPADYQKSVACPAADTDRSISVIFAGGHRQINFSIHPPHGHGPGGQAGHHHAFFDIDVLCFPLVVRNWQPGDRLQPFGMTGTKKVRRLLSEHRVPAEYRAGWPVVLSRNDIIWVPGVGRGNTAPLGPRTRSVLAAVVSSGSMLFSRDATPAATGPCPEGEDR